MMRSLTTLLGIACLAIACTGGGSSSDEGGIGGSGISRGAITATGSAVVAGTRYETPPGTTLIFDGDDMSGRSLERGMTVRVTGTRSGDQGTASEVEFDDAIEGPVSAVDPHPTNPRRATLIILAQSVEIEEGFTLFAGTSFATVGMGDVVEVSGFRTDDGEIRATRVEFVSTDATPEVELKGVVTNLDTSVPADASFEIGPISVRFAIGSTQLPDGTPEDGDFVEVEGVFDGIDTVDATTAMDRIEREEPDTGDVDDYEIEGVVSNFVSLADFQVDGQPVFAGGFGTEFEPPTSSFVADGELIEVEGRLENGVLLASKVKWRSGEARVVAQVDQAPVGGMVTLLGATQVEADAATRFDDECDDGMVFDEIADLQVGDFVQVRGVRVAAARVLATEIECRDGGGDVEVRGRVEAFDGTFGTVTILGLLFPVEDPPTTVFEEFPAPGVSNSTEFFSFLASNPNALLEAKDADDGDAADFDLATEVEYAEDDG